MMSLRLKSRKCIPVLLILDSNRYTYILKRNNGKLVDLKHFFQHVWRDSVEAHQFVNSETM